MPHNEIINLIHDRIKLELEGLKKLREKEIKMLHLDIRRKGQINSTAAVDKTKEFCSKEIKNAVEKICVVIERFIIVSNEGDPNRLSTELRNIAEGYLYKHIGNYKGWLPSEMKTAALDTTLGFRISGAENNISSELKRGLDKINNEIDLYMYSLKNGKKQHMESSNKEKDIIMGDKYEIQGGQQGHVGSANAETINYNQVWSQGTDNPKLNELAEELTRLRIALREKAKQEDDENLDKAIVAVTDARNATQKKDGPRALQYLAKAGPLALKTAKEIGLEIASRVIIKSMGSE